MKDKNESIALNPDCPTDGSDKNKSQGFRLKSLFHPSKKSKPLLGN